MVRQADPVFPDRELFAADMPTPPATTQSAGEASHAPMSPSQFAGDFLASAGIHGSDFMLGDDQPPFTTAGDTSLTMDELASFGLSLGINLADMQQDFSLPPTSIPNPLSPANSWSPTASGGANYDGTTGHAMGMGPMASGLPVSTADFASLPVEHQMALLQQPDFMSNFVQGGPPSVMAPVAQRPVSPLEIAQPGSPMRTASASPKRPASRNRTRRGQAGESVGSIRRSPATFQKSGVMVAPDSGVMLDEAIEDAERTARLSPLVSPAMTPSVDFQKMSLGAAAHAEASGLTPLSSPAIQANKVDSFEMEPMSLGRSASGGPSRVGKRGDGSDGLSSPALVAAPYQVPMTGRRRGAKGSSPALGPSPRLNPAGVGRVGSAKLQSPATMPEQMTPELMTMAQQMVPTTLGDAALAAKQMPPGTTFAETQNMPTFAMPNSNNLTGMPMAGMNAPGKNSPLVMPSNGPVPMGMPLPPPAMGPATPASLLNMGRGPGGPPFIPQIPAPFMGVGFHIDPTTGQQFLSPPLGPTEFLLSGGNDPADMRRSSHKVAEQKRRDSLRLCFDELRDLLPPDVIRDEKNPSKVFILKKSADLIRYLRQENEQLRAAAMGSQRRGRSSTGEAFSKDDDKERREYEDFRRWKRQFEQQEQRQSSVERGAQATTAGKDDDMEDFEDDE